MSTSSSSISAVSKYSSIFAKSIYLYLTFLSNLFTSISLDLIWSAGTLLNTIFSPVFSSEKDINPVDVSEFYKLSILVTLGAVFYSLFLLIIYLFKILMKSALDISLLVISTYDINQILSLI